MRIGTALRARKPAAHLEAVELRQHHVQDHEVDLVFVEARQSLLAVPRLHDLEPLVLERIGEELLDRLLVVDEAGSGAFRHGSKG
jgi:hypothetical protein